MVCSTGDLDKNSLDGETCTELIKAKYILVDPAIDPKDALQLATDIAEFCHNYLEFAVVVRIPKVS